jgi:long-chain-fatty-acid--CoA ligase ACSBG
LTHIVQWGGNLPAPPVGSPPKVLSWAAFLAHAEATPADALDQRAALIKPGHCCSLIYTSGTTGNPKVTLHVHRIPRF